MTKNSFEQMGISPNCEPVVVAEIGINHGGSLDVAKRMVEAIHLAGGKWVKHQTHCVEDEMTDEAKHVYPGNADSSIWDVIEANSLCFEDEARLKEFTESAGIHFISTPFSRKAADFLNELGVEAFKIGSGECSNLPLIKHIASFGKPIIMSTGMHSTTDIIDSVNLCRDAEVECLLLECTNNYPTKPENVSLRGLDELRYEFGSDLVGYSDHTIGPWIALAAIARGAVLIEKHFTDSRYRVGPDIVCSMDPAELKILIDRSAEIYQALQSEKIRKNSEEVTFNFARSSVVADKDIRAGTIITEADIWARRPGTGEIEGARFYDVVGKRTLRDLVKNEQISWRDLV